MNSAKSDDAAKGVLAATGRSNITIIGDVLLDEVASRDFDCVFCPGDPTVSPLPLLCVKKEPPLAVCLSLLCVKKSHHAPQSSADCAEQAARARSCCARTLV